MYLGFPISLKFGSNLSSNAVKLHVIFHNYTIISTPCLAAPSRLPKWGSQRSLIFDPNPNLLRSSGTPFQPPRPRYSARIPRNCSPQCLFVQWTSQNALPTCDVMRCDASSCQWSPVFANGLRLCQWPPSLPMASGYPSRKIRLILCLSYRGILTHCGLVMPYGDLNMHQHWLR